MQPLSSWLRLTTALLFVGLLSALWLVLLLVTLPSRVLRIKLCNFYGKFVGSAVVRVFFACKVIFRHRERINESLPAIYITNHSSAIDIFLSMWTCPIGGCGIAKKEIGKIPVFGQFYKLSGHLLIDRSQRDKAIEAMQKVTELVKSKKLSIWIWPEGTRSRSGRLLNFKKGFVHMALATGFPIVPVVVHNAYKAWPKNSGRIYPTTLEVEVLPAIDTSQWTLETIEDHVRETHAKFIEVLGPDQKPEATKSP